MFSKLHGIAGMYVLRIWFEMQRLTDCARHPVIAPPEEKKGKNGADWALRLLSQVILSVTGYRGAL